MHSFFLLAGSRKLGAIEQHVVTHICMLCKSNMCPYVVIQFIGTLAFIALQMLAKDCAHY